MLCRSLCWHGFAVKHGESLRDFSPLCCGGVRTGLLAIRIFIAGSACGRCRRHVGFFLIVALVGSALRAKSDIAAERIALLKHSKRLEHEIVNFSEAEQRRIGQDLHDGLCQYLAGLTCSASSLRDDLEKLDLHTAANTADELVTLLQDAVVQTRDLARKLVPSQVSRLGLVLALESLAQSVTRPHGVNCRLRSHISSANWDEYTAMHFIALRRRPSKTRQGAENRGKFFSFSTQPAVR